MFDILAKLFPPRNLWSAAKRGDVAAVDRLIAAGHDVNAKRLTYDAEAPLHFAARSGHLDVIRALVTHGGKINAKDSGGETPLMTAVWAQQRSEVIEAMLGLGANINAQDKASMTALDCAAFQGDAARVGMLLKLGAKPNVGEGKKRSSPISHCVTSGSMEVLELLLAAKADVNALDAGSSALGSSAVLCRMDFVKALLITGADASAQDHFSGYTVLMRGVAGGNLEIVEAIVEAGANIDALNLITRETALDIAENREKLDISAYLRGIGAKREKELDESNSSAETFWQLPNELLLSVSIKPSVSKAGAAKLCVEISEREGHSFSGRIEYRVAPTAKSSEPWRLLCDGKEDEDGNVVFEDSIHLIQGANIVEFRLRAEGDDDFDYPEGWQVIAK